METIVIVSGGFDPLHEGHIALFETAANLGDKLIVLLNSDEWLVRKKGYRFQTWDTRYQVVSHIEGVDAVFSFDDSDGTACKGIEKVQKYFGPQNQYIFANGGDRTEDNIPEMIVSDVEFVFGVGGEDKKNSSSEIVKEFMDHGTVERAWGTYRVIEEASLVETTDDEPIKYIHPRWKIKELIVEPNHALSYQLHFNRKEFWLVKSGRGTAIVGDKTVELFPGITVNILVNTWHQLINGGNEPLIIHEVQTGICTEDDIIRQNYQYRDVHKRRFWNEQDLDITD